MKYCIDCGKKLDIESAVPVEYGGKRAYICIRCYRSGVRLNPLSGFIIPTMYELNPAGAKLYQSFHGNPPARTRKIKYSNLKPNETLVKIGRLVQLEYEPEYPSQHVNKRFYHKLGDTGRIVLKDKPILATRLNGKGLFILNDKSNPIVTSRGIIG